MIVITMCDAGVTKEEVSVQADGDVLMIGVEQQEIAPLVAGSRYIKCARPLPCNRHLGA